MKYSAADKFKEAVRETKMRREVYKRRVDAGGMSAAEAARKIAIMQQIADDYGEAVKRERLI